MSLLADDERRCNWCGKIYWLEESGDVRCCSMACSMASIYGEIDGLRDREVADEAARAARHARRLAGLDALLSECRRIRDL